MWIFTPNPLNHDAIVNLHHFKPIELEQIDDHEWILTATAKDYPVVIVVKKSKNLEELHSLRLALTPWPLSEETAPTTATLH